MLAVRTNDTPALYDRIAELEELVAYYKGELGMALAADQVMKVSRRWHLTPHEASVVVALVQAKGRACTKTHLVEAIYAGRDEPELKIIDVFVCKVRRKIGDGMIDTLWGKGYAATANLIAQVEALKAETLPGVTPAAKSPPRNPGAWIILNRLKAGVAEERELFTLVGGTLLTFVSLVRHLEREGLVTREGVKLEITAAGTETAKDVAA